MTTSSTPTLSMQGVVVPQSSVNPKLFKQLTRRLTFLIKTASFAGLGLTDQFPVLQTGIVAGITIRFTGTLTVTHNTGSVATTPRFPYDLIKAIRFTANGQSNLVNVSGAKLKVRDVIQQPELTDRGVSRGIGGASPGTATTQGTLSLASESWGVGSNVTAIPTGAYVVDLNWYVPVAWDLIDLIGAIFAQTSSTDLNIQIDWAAVSDILTITGNDTAVLTGTYIAEGIVFTIPQDGQGGIVVPDLSAFHSMIQSRYLPVTGLNEIRLPGQGVGRQLMRLFWQTWNGASPAPVPVNATNYGQQGWRFGGNDTPEIFTDGQHLREFNERWFNSDLGAVWGFLVMDFASQNMFRDSIDEASATDLRILHELLAGLSLTSPFTEFVQETIFAGAVGA